MADQGRRQGNPETSARAQEEDAQVVVVTELEELTEEERKFVLLVLLYYYIRLFCFWTRWLVLTVDDWKQWWSGLKAASKELKTRLSTAYELTMKIIKLLFFTFQFVYPLVLFLLDIEDLSYNITCLVVGFIGMVKDGYETVLGIRKLLKKRRESTSEQQSAETNSQTPEEESDSGRAAKKFRKRVKDVGLDIMEEILIYPAIICDVFGFVNNEVYKYEKGTDYVDTVLLVYGIALNLIDKQIRRVILLYRTWKALCNAYPSARVRSKCVLCCGNGLLPWFIVHFAILSVVHFFMIALVGIRCFYDNMDKHDYTATVQNQFLIAAAVCLPMVSIIMYFLMNKVWVVEMFLNIKRDSDPNYQNKRLEVIAKSGRYKRTLAPLADVKAVFFGSVWVLLIAYAAIATQINPINDVLNSPNSTNTETTKDLDVAIFVNNVVRVVVWVTLILANIQTALFSYYVNLILGLITIIVTPLILIIVFLPVLLIPCCICVACVCLYNKVLSTKTCYYIKFFFTSLWTSLIT